MGFSCAITSAVVAIASSAAAGAAHLNIDCMFLSRLLFLLDLPRGRQARYRSDAPGHCVTSRSDQQTCGGARGRLGGNRVDARAGASWTGAKPLKQGGRKKTVQRATTTGFALPSQSERLPQPQRCPEPGGQAGDQDCSRKLLAAPPAFPACGTPSCARTAAGARPNSNVANRTRSPLTRAILAGSGLHRLRQLVA